MVAYEMPGECPAGETTTRHFELQIPTCDEEKDEMYEDIPAHFQPLMKQLSSTVNGKINEVEYVLKCIIKHEGFCEFGEGAVASMPIQILQPPM